MKILGPGNQNELHISHEIMTALGLKCSYSKGNRDMFASNIFGFITYLSLKLIKILDITVIAGMLRRMNYE